VRPIDSIVTDADIATFARDGVVCLRGVLDAPWIEKLRRGVDEVLARPGPMAWVNRRPGDTGKFAQEIYPWLHNADFRDFVFNAPLRPVVARLLAARRLCFLTDLMLVKEPHTPTPTPWHHDQPYGFHDGDQIVGCWVGLDRTDAASGAVEWIRGSHRWGRWFRPQSFDGKTDWGGHQFETMPDIEAERAKYDIAQFATEPGDVVINHLMTVHGAPGNNTDRRRRAITFRYGGDDARYVFRPGAPAPPRAHALKDGDPFGCELFPEVWPPKDEARAARG
jgi:ectoine hydroxylase-related dioxygenase (phytanoyl-CoA dioxygenase family)